jgi:raffinose/stachyose/melibiose transport system permease protein
MCGLILSNFIRDAPRELFESMRLDGCTDWQMAWKLAFPLTRPAIVTVSIYNGLNVWNGFLFALILTQSPEKRVMPLALWAFQGEYQVNIPGCAGRCGAIHSADLDSLHRRSSPAAPWLDRGIR